jgi:cytochrome d ubiquinol oxidase subunit II
MSVVALILVPVILVYQGWTYYVFRRRLGLGEDKAEEAPAVPGSEPAA